MNARTVYHMQGTASIKCCAETEMNARTVYHMHGTALIKCMQGCNLGSEASVFHNS